MKLHELKPAVGSVSAPKRVGRGTGSGLGKTSGKGHKGQKARSGGVKRSGFEGGQMPLYRRLPRRGFHNHFSKQFALINISDLDAFEAGAVVTPELLCEYGIVRKLLDGVKVLGKGEVTKALTVKAAHFSESAKAKIEAAGGSIEVIE